MSPPTVLITGELYGNLGGCTSWTPLLANLAPTLGIDSLEVFIIFGGRRKVYEKVGDLYGDSQRHIESCFLFVADFPNLNSLLGFISRTKGSLFLSFSCGRLIAQN